LASVAPCSRQPPPIAHPSQQPCFANVLAYFRFDDRLASLMVNNWPRAPRRERERSASGTKRNCRRGTGISGVGGRPAAASACRRQPPLTLTRPRVIAQLGYNIARWRALPRRPEPVPVVAMKLVIGRLRPLGYFGEDANRLATSATHREGRWYAAALWG
jgi:hypothetical protein